MAMAEKPDEPKGARPPAERRERGGWLSRIAPGVRKAFAKKTDTPENLWVKCPDTGEMIYRPDLEAALWVTPAGRHMRIGSKLRLGYTFDNGKYEVIPSPQVSDDPLNFSDGRPYGERLAAARKATGATAAMAIGVGTIKGQKAVMAGSTRFHKASMTLCSLVSWLTSACTRSRSSPACALRIPDKSTRVATPTFSTLCASCCGCAQKKSESRHSFTTWSRTLTLHWKI